MLTRLLNSASDSTVLAAVSSAENTPIALAGVLLSLVIIYFSAKLMGELCVRVNLPPVLGELLAGVLVGISAFNLLVFPMEGGFHSVLLDFLQATAGLQAEAAPAVGNSISEVISVLSEIGVIILLFEIGLESDLKELIRLGPQATVVAVVGVAAPFLAGTIGLILLFGIAPIPAIFCGRGAECNQYWHYGKGLS